LKSLLPLLLALAARCVASVSIQTTTLPNGVRNDGYYAVITAKGGCIPFTWQVTTGQLPNGVTMTTSSSTKSVTLSGTPSKAATYSFTVAATGCGGHTAQASYKVVVQASAEHVVGLSWDASASTDVVGYNVYRGPDGKSWSKINPSLAASTAYGDSTVANSSSYFYATTAVDEKGNESKKSNLVKAAIP